MKKFLYFVTLLGGVIAAITLIIDHLIFERDLSWLGMTAGVSFMIIGIGYLIGLSLSKRKVKIGRLIAASLVLLVFGIGLIDSGQPIYSSLFGSTRMIQERNVFYIATGIVLWLLALSLPIWMFFLKFRFSERKSEHPV